MLNLGSKTSPSSLVFSIPSNFRNHCWGTETGIFAWPSCIAFVKNDRITISVPIIVSINQWRLYHLKKCWMDSQIYISQLSTSLCFYKVLFVGKKIDVRLNKTLKLKSLYRSFFIVSIRHVLPTPWLSIQFTPISYWRKDYSNGLVSYFATLSYG